MVKKLTLNCSFKSGIIPVEFYVGNPAKDSNPIQFQSQWLSKEKGGKVPKEIMESLEQLHQISEKNRVAFEDICEYVFAEVNSAKQLNQASQTMNKKVEFIKNKESGKFIQSDNKEIEEEIK